MSRWTLGLLVALMAGCTSMMAASRTPTVQQFAVQESLDAAYEKAVRTALSIGAIMTAQDRQGYTFTATMRDAVSLHVAIQPALTGTTLIVSGLLLPNKIVIGTMTEVDEFVAAYRKD